MVPTYQLVLYGAAKFPVGLSSLGVVNISGFFFADHLHPPPECFKVAASESTEFLVK